MAAIPRRTRGRGVCAPALPADRPYAGAAPPVRPACSEIRPGMDPGRDRNPGGRRGGGTSSWDQRHPGTGATSRSPRQGWQTVSHRCHRAGGQTTGGAGTAEPTTLPRGRDLAPDLGPRKKRHAGPPDCGGTADGSPCSATHPLRVVSAPSPTPMDLIEVRCVTGAGVRERSAEIWGSSGLTRPCRMVPSERHPDKRPEQVISFENEEAHRVRCSFARILTDLRKQRSNVRYRPCAGGTSREGNSYRDFQVPGTALGRPSSRAISIRCTSEVPSPISRILASRKWRATGNSSMKP